jgi:hypothetical protein
VIAPFGAARELLCSIPGIDQRLAEGIIGEIGVDMSRFPTAQHLASWAGMCPGQHESAGKSRTGRARHGDTWLQRHLAVAAMAAARDKDNYFAAQYAQLARPPITRTSQLAVLIAGDERQPVRDARRPPRDQQTACVGRGLVHGGAGRVVRIARYARRPVK